MPAPSENIEVTKKVKINEQLEPPDPHQLSCLVRGTDNLSLHPAVTTVRPGWSLFTFAEAEVKAKQYANEIASNCRQLKHILDRREGVIRKRWLKKTLAERRNVLLTACPNMCDKHRPDWQQYMPWCRSPANRTLAAYKWPQINLEDLEGPDNFLLFLESRGHTQPHNFAYADLVHLLIGLHTGIIGVEGLQGYTMLLHNSQQNYGKIVWHTVARRNYSEVPHTHAVDAGDGMLVLAVQSKIWDFLLRCCVKIMTDVPKDRLLSGELIAQPRLSPVPTNAATDLFLAGLEQTYKVPTSLDMTKLFQLIETKKCAEEDHLWELREDPGYFMSRLLMDRTHRLNDSLRPKLPAGTSEKDILGMVTVAVAADSHVVFALWSALLEQATKLKVLSPLGKVDLEHQNGLPTGMKELVIDMMNTVMGLLKLLTTDLNAAVEQSLGYKPMVFTRSNALSLSLGKQVPSPTPVDWIYDYESDDKLEILFSMLYDKESPPVMVLNPVMVVEEIQRLFRGSATQKKRLSTYATELFADLALVTHIVKSLRPLLKFNQKTLATMDLNIPGPEVLPIYHELVAMFMQDLGNTPMFPRLCGIVRSGNLEYPADKPTTKDTVDVIRRAEQHLDKIWDIIDTMTYSKVGRTLSQVWRRLSEERHLRRTPPWVPRRVRLPEPSTGQDLTGTWSDMPPEPEQPRRFQPESEKAKVKTRGSPQPASTTEEVPIADYDQTPPASEPSLTFELGKRQWKVFSTMFYTPTEGRTPGEISWSDFLNAMTAIRFSAEKLGGSAWHFTHAIPELETKHGIQFHEPHPSDKIPFFEAKRMGRRLARLYGFSGASFKRK